MKRGEPLKRTPLKRISQLTAKKKVVAKKRTKIKPVSKKRQKEQKTYSTLSKAYLAIHPICECGGCFHLATQIHHRGRRGKNFLNDDLFMAVCSPCHEQIEANGNWARAQGYLLTAEQIRELDD